MGPHDGDRAREELGAARERIAGLERALARAEAERSRFEKAHEASFDAVALLRAVRDEAGAVVDFEYEYANPVALRFIHRTEESIRGARLLEVVPGHREHQDLYRRFVRVVETGVAERVELSYHAEGIDGWFQSVAAKLDDGIALFFHDVTEAKLHEVALRRSETETRLLAERYRGLVDALAEIVWSTDPQGKSIRSSSWRRFTGQSKSEAAGYGWVDAVHPEDRPSVAETIRRGAATFRPFRISFRLRTATGRYRYVESRAVPLFDPDGTMREWMGVVLDDDERRRAEEAVRRRELEFVTLAEGAPDVIARFDRNLRVRYVNRALTELANLDPAACVGKTPRELGTPAEIARIWEAELEATLGKGEPRTFEFEATRASGERVFLQARLVPEVDDAGRVRGTIAVLRDLTDLRRKEEALEETESYLRLAQRSAAMGVFGLDFDRGTSRWSAGSYALYGRDRALPSPTYDEWLSMIHPDDRPTVEQATRGVLEGRDDVWRVQFRILHPVRRERWLLELGQRTGRKGAGVTLDVTEQKRAEERLKQSAKMEAVGRLAGGLAHDFNNQLQVIRGFASVVARDPGLAARSRGQLEEIGRAVDRMGSLTSQLLAFSRQQVLRPESVDLDAAIAEDEAMLRRLVGATVGVRTELGPGVKWVRVDRAQLLQVLLNLCINARDAMRAGGEVTIRTRVRELGARDEVQAVGAGPVEPGRYAELSVEDQGEGIPPDVLAHVFEPFFTTKEIGRGTGLGLATVHGVVTQSHGHVWVESTPGRGTRVMLLLPTTGEEPRAVAKERGAEREVRGGRVLVVEDEAAVRRFLADALRGSGFTVFEAENGRDALGRLEGLREGVDLVLTDVVMPVMGGRELADELVRRGVDAPIVFLSGYTRETALEDAGLGRQRPFLQKPVSAERLVEAVQAALVGRRAPETASPKRAER